MKAAVPAVSQRDIAVLQDYMLTLPQALPPAAPLQEQRTDADSNSSSAEQQQQQVYTLPLVA
jgi:hypothetical protein